MRSIPAWAGETEVAVYAAIGGQVYPRVGGGNFPSDSGETKNCGLSPRGRGKRNPLTTAAARARSIPAWAGETPRPTLRR